MEDLSSIKKITIHKISERLSSQRRMTLILYTADTADNTISTSRYHYLADLAEKKTLFCFFVFLIPHKIGTNTKEHMVDVHVRINKKRKQVNLILYTIV